MSRKPSSDPLLRAGDIRVATDSLYAGTKPAGDHVDIRDDALLAMPVLSKEAAEWIDHQAKVGACDLVISATGCEIEPATDDEPAKPCLHPDHAAPGGHQDQALELLRALRLIRDPLSVSHTDPWGRRVRPKDGAA